MRAQTILSRLEWRAFRVAFLILGGSLALATELPGQADEPKQEKSNSVEHEAYMELLRAKDAQFDNVSVEYETHSKVISPDADKLQAALKEGADLPTVDVPTHYRLTVRGHETTLETTAFTDPSGKPLAVPTVVRSSNSSGIEQRFETIAERRIFRKLAAPPAANDLLSYYRMLAEFSLGVGYARRIVSIQSMERDGDETVLVARMRLYGKDETVAKLHIGKELLVRSANLDTDLEGDETRIEIESQGDWEGLQSGKEVAKSAKVKTSSIAMMDGGTRKPLDRINLIYTFETKSVEYDLTQARYAEFALVSDTNATDIIDEGKLQERNVPAAPTPRTSAKWLLVCNAIAVALLAALLLAKRLKRRSN